MSMPSVDLLPIREVARLTGVTAVTLRAWERRYGLIQPHRTPKGHRLYTPANVEQIQTIVAWLGRGVAVSHVRELLSRPSLSLDLDDSPWGEWRRDLLEGLLGFDVEQADRVYNQAISSYPIHLACERLLEPALEDLQLRWAGRFGDAVERAFACTWLRARVSARIYQNNCLHPGASVLLSNLSEDSRQPGFWLLAAMLSQSGRRVELLDWSVPVAELGLMAERQPRQAIVLYAYQALTNEQLRRELPALMQQVSLPVYLAGPASLIHHTGLQALGIVPTGESPCGAYARVSQELRGPF